MNLHRVLAPLRFLRGMFDPSRLAQAARTAIAAGVAWFFAPYVPFTADEYSYYAPLGVLVSMYPTIARSARSGAQTLAGLALGIALGFGGIWLVWREAPGILAVALVVGVGVMLGGIERLGAGREWVAMAGLFVLLLGGPTPQDYSVSYLLTMAFGVAVGLIANVVLFPPLHLQRADTRLSSLRDAVAGHLHDIADAVTADELAPDWLDRTTDELGETVAQVSEAVRDADESSTGNPRARGRQGDRERIRRRLHALERIVFSTRDLADVLARAREHENAAAPDAAPDLLADAIHRAADLVAHAPGGDGADRQLDAAVAALDRYTAAVDEAKPDAPSRAAGDLTAAICLRRIVDATRPLI